MHWFCGSRDKLIFPTTLSTDPPPEMCFGDTTTVHEVKIGQWEEWDGKSLNEFVGEKVGVRFVNKSQVGGGTEEGRVKVILFEVLKFW